MSKRIKRISKALDSAVIASCDSYGPTRTDAAGGFSSTTGGTNASEIRDMFDIWWRFNLVSGSATGQSNNFDRHFEFDQTP